MDTKKQFEKILSPVIKSILHFLKIHRKVIFGNSPVIVQDMLGKRPESLDAVNMILGAPIHQRFTVTDRMMLAQSLQGIVAAEGVSIVYCALPGLLPDDCHQFFLGDMLHNLRVDLAIAFQKAKNDIFALSSSAAHALASAAKVALIHFNLAIELAAVQLGNMVDGLAQALVQAGDRLIIHAKVMSQTIGWLLLVESLDDGDLSAYFSQRLLFSTAFVSASDISSRCFGYLKRTTKYALSTLQKVGRTTENILSPLYHMMILTPHGYETH